MSRYLFVSLPLPGHVHPMAAVAAALTGRDHEVAWAGSESFLRPLVGPDATVFPIPLRAHRGQSERGMAATKSRWEGYIVPHARTTFKGVTAAAAEFRPDVLFVDQHAVAGAVVALHHGIPWASAAPTTMEITRPYRSLPRVETWIAEQLATVWRNAGMPGEPPRDLRFSPDLLIAFTGAALTGDLPEVPGARLVGPALAQRAADPTFPWDWLDPARRQILVTMGTLSMDLAPGYYRRMVEALRPLAGRVQAVVVAPDGTIPEPEPHLLVRPRVPVLELMPRLSAVVCHGGLNTVCEALYHGVPLVVAPIKSDQAVNAAQVAAAGAGVRVSFDRARPEALRDALLAVLDEPRHGAAAAAVGAALAAAGGAGAAARHLEDFATHHLTTLAESGRHT